MSSLRVNDLLGPFMKILWERHQCSIKEMVDQIAINLGLSLEEMTQTIPSGRETVLQNKVGWTRTYLKKAGLVESPRRGWVGITPEGRKAIRAAGVVDINYLNTIPEFVEFRNKRSTGNQREKSNQIPAKKKNLTHLIPIEFGMDQSGAYQADQVSLSFDGLNQRIYFQFSKKFNRAISKEVIVSIPFADEAPISHVTTLCKILNDISDTPKR